MARRKATSGTLASRESYAFLCKQKKAREDLSSCGFKKQGSVQWICLENKVVFELAYINLIWLGVDGRQSSKSQSWFSPVRSYFSWCRPEKDKAELPLLPSEVEYGSRFAEYLLIEGFKPLKRKDISLCLKRCGFRRVTPTFCKFLDNRSRIMPAAGTHPIFAHTSLFDLFYFPPFFFLVT
ncbi:hypothetical protein EUTSA_v10002912mg [Eutrema salsugineum]|uniref:Uncharacterized protein n=1 Tax=Eutrema salsugineum TaxID=72664 RepID=V4MWZ6_EUTSA|nr:hypothetical protein EUTSA_v10002912mg [Eutrema salsugineum]